ncbi:MAG: hypothetical protein MR536_06455 [Prevotella sp.]|nr:hypothetical protein [Prevotella sp.]MDY3852939.1 hypothetical protein [Prevotella sp.]
MDRKLLRRHRNRDGKITQKQLPYNGGRLVVNFCVCCCRNKLESNDIHNLSRF